MTTRALIYCTLLFLAARQNWRGSKTLLFHPGEPVLRALPFLTVHFYKEHKSVCLPC